MILVSLLLGVVLGGAYMFLISSTHPLSRKLVYPLGFFVFYSSAALRYTTIDSQSLSKFCFLRSLFGVVSLCCTPVLHTWLSVSFYCLFFKVSFLCCMALLHSGIPQYTLSLFLRSFFQSLFLRLCCTPVLHTWFSVSF